MKNVKLIIVFISLHFSTSAQEVLLNIPDSGKTIFSFIPTDYLIRDSASGDLNRDGKVDYVFVLTHKNEDTFEMDEEPKRILLVLLKLNSSYKIGGKSLEALMCRHCGGMYGDPFSSLNITKGVLSIYHYGGSSWRWSEVRKFRMQQNGMYLIGSTSDLYWTMQACNNDEVGNAGRQYRDINFVTGQEEIIERTEECKLIKHVRQKIKKEPLVKLEDFSFEEL